ncbi:MAG: hypothetical protein ACREM3_05585 [Candidatus Rokuibacteriota bacterium]
MPLDPDLLEILPHEVDAVLDNLPPFQGGRFLTNQPPRSISQAVEEFTRRYPKGFLDAAYIGDRRAGERAYKWSAHELWSTTLGTAEARHLVEGGRVDEVVRRALVIEGRLNLLFPTEKAALRDGLRDSKLPLDYFKALYALLDAADVSRDLFNAYIGALERLPSHGKTPINRWPILTLFPFIAEPARFMFLKPGITTDCADRLAFDLGYESRLNWVSYERLLVMSRLLLDRLRPLGARDFIDVQSFMWLIGQWTDG